MSRDLRIPSPGRQLGYYFLFLAAGLLVANLVVGMILLAPLKPGTAHDANDLLNSTSIEVLKILQSFASLVTFLIPAWLFARYVFPERPFHYLGFRAVSKNSFYVLAVAALLLSFPLDGWLGQLNRGIALPAWMIDREKEADRQIIAFLKTNSTMGVLVNIFVIALLPAICEEASFRGALQPILIRIFKSPWAGIVVTAIFFSAFHMQFQGFLTRMLLGLLLGAIYWYSGSLLVSIAAHFFTNAIQVIIVAYYPRFVTEDPTVPFYLAMISLIIVAALLAVMRHQSKTKYPEDSYAKEFQ
jgi:membrane protease YdiL (CAAX protease family)